MKWIKMWGRKEIIGGVRGFMKGIKPKYSQPVRNKNREKHTPKKNNHTHKTVFIWFGTLPTSTELQGYHYYHGRIQSTTFDYNIFSLYKTEQQHHTKKS